MDPSNQWQQPGPQQPYGQPQQPGYGQSQPQQPPYTEQYTVDSPYAQPQQPAPPQHHQPQYPQQHQQPQQEYPQPYSALPYATQPNSAPPYQQPVYQQPAYEAGPPTAPPAKRNKLFASLVIAAVLLVVMAISVVVVALTRDGDEGPATVAAPSTSPSHTGPVDPCLVGKWRQTSYQKVVDLTGTDVDKREGIGKVKMQGAGKVWTINADGSATEDDTATVYSGKDDKGRAIDANFSGKTEWQLKSVGRTIEYAGKESTSAVVISVDGRKAGTIELEPNLDPSNYTCVGDVWRHTSQKDVDSFAKYDRVK